MSSVFTCKLNPCCGDPLLCDPPEQYDFKSIDNDGCVCESCKQSFYHDMLVPDVVWEKIKPEGKPEGGGLLCPNCILERCNDRCGWTVGFLYSERHGNKLVAGVSGTNLTQNKE